MRLLLRILLWFVMLQAAAFVTLALVLSIASTP